MTDRKTDDLQRELSEWCAAPYETRAAVFRAAYGRELPRELDGSISLKPLKPRPPQQPQTARQILRQKYRGRLK